MTKHECKAEKAHSMAVIVKGDRSSVRAECKNGSFYKLAKGEKVAIEFTMNTTSRADIQRLDAWDAVCRSDDDVPALVFTLHAYRAVCERLGIFERDNGWFIYQYAALNLPSDKDCKLLVDTVREVIGDEAADGQAEALSKAGREAWAAKRAAKKSVEKDFVEPKLPTLPKLKVMPKTTAKVSSADIAKRTVVLVFTAHSIGNRRKVSTSEVEVGEADKNWLAVSKKLIEAPELRAINLKISKTRAFIESLSLPALIKKGVYQLPVDYVTTIDERIAADRKELKEVLVPAFAKVYAACIIESEKRLGPKLFNRKDYLSVDELIERFDLEWRYVTINTPASLEQIDKMVWKKEQEKAERAMQELVEATEKLLNAEFLDAVKNLIEKLSPNKNGQNKGVRDGALDQIRGFLNTYAPRNIGNSEQIKPFIERAQALLTGFDEDTLKQSQNVRDFVRDGFKEINTLLEPMIVTKPKRAIAFDED